MEPADPTDAVTGSTQDRPDPDTRADELYAGTRAHLRAIHDAVLTLAQGLGEDARREVRDGDVLVVRRTPFVAVAPGPRDTVRVGFHFRRPPEDERLSVASGFAQATHWLHLSADSDEDDLRLLEPLLEAAYLQNG